MADRTPAGLKLRSGDAWLVCFIIAIFVFLSCSTNFLTKFKNAFPQCGNAYWEQLEKFGEKLTIWQMIETQTFIEKIFGHEFILTSEATYPPCNIRVADGPLPETRKNFVIVRINGSEVYRHEWYGGLIVAISVARADSGDVLLFTHELMYDQFSRGVAQPTRFLRYHDAWTRGP